MKHRYYEEINKRFDINDESKIIFDRIIKTSSQKRDSILSDLNSLINHQNNHQNLAYALIALYRQQVNTGFVLADPLQSDGRKEKRIYDINTGITFILQWNPNRELKKDHNLLIERGVIVNNIDESTLINRDKNGRACYLCKANIDIQNPAEILFEIDLAGEKYYVGANFAYITNNHFTIMNADHRPQQYRKKILDALNDFVDKTNGNFRAIFNGLAGASIEEHEHLQATTEIFPIEDIRIGKEYIVYVYKHQTDDLKIFQPKYYIPTWIIEGTNKNNVIDVADKIITSWHDLDTRYHTENIICVKIGPLYRTFIITRDKRKLTCKGKKGEMATFDTGGNIVLSCDSKDNEINERATFDYANFETIKNMLEDVSPTMQIAQINSISGDIEYGQ